MIARAGDSLQVMGILAWRAVARTLRSQWLSLGLSACIYAEAEITVLRITTAFLFSLVDLLKQSSVTNQDPEQSGEPIATIWHLGQESILLAPLITRRRETGPCCSATVYGGRKEGCPDFPLLLLPVQSPSTQPNLHSQWQLGPHALFIWSCQSSLGPAKIHLYPYQTI